MRWRITAIVGTAMILFFAGCKSGNQSQPHPDAGASVPSLVIPFAFAVPTFGIADFLADGSTVLLICATDFEQRNLPIPLPAIRIASDGSMTDVTSKLLPDAPMLVHGRQGFVHDFNGDGAPDFFGANTGWDQSPWPGEHQLVLLSSPDHTLRAATLPPILDYAHSGAIGDLRRSGRFDIYIDDYNGTPNPGLPAAYMGPNTYDGRVGPYILRNDGGGVFTYDNVSLPQVLAKSYTAPKGTPGRHTAALLVDLDQDGTADLVAGADQSGAVAGAIFMNDGSGSFANATAQLLPPGLYGANNTITIDIESMDLNGDGYPDLLMSQTPDTPQFYGGRRVQIFVNDGHGGMTDDTMARMPSQPGGPYDAPRLFLADWDKDGDVDLFMQVSFDNPITPGVTSQDVLLYLNDGSGHFAPAPDSILPPRSLWHQLVPIDFNKDGRIDVIDLEVENWNKQGNPPPTKVTLRSYAGKP